MKRWAVLTMLLYALALLILSLPATLVAFGNWGKNASQFGLPQVLQM